MADLTKFLPQDDDELAQFTQNYSSTSPQQDELSPDFIGPPSYLATSEETKPASSGRLKTVDEYKELFNKASGKSPVSSAFNTSDMLSKLLKDNSSDVAMAQNTANQNKLWAALGQAGATAGAALSPLANVKPNNEFYEQLQKSANAPLDHVEAQQAQADKAVKHLSATTDLKRELSMNDANSPESQAARERLQDLYSEMGRKLKVDSNLSAKDIDPLYKQELQHADRKNTMEMNKLQKQAFLDQQKSNLDWRVVNQTNSRYDKETKPITNKLESVQRVEHLLQAIENGQIVGTEQLNQILGTDLAILAAPTGGSTTGHERDALKINSMGGDLAKIKQYVTANPTKAIPTSFLPNLKKELGTLKDSWLDTFHRNSKQFQAGLPNQSAKQIAEDRYQTYLDSFNEGVKQYEPDVTAYAQKHGITPEEAQRIKDQRTKGQ